MSKKIAVLGLALVLAGGALFEWTRRLPSPLHQLFPEAVNDATTEAQMFSVDDLEDSQDLDHLLASLQNKPQAEIERAQKARLIAKIGQLATEGAPESILSDTLYGPHWKAKVKRYKQLMGQREFVTIGSIILGLLGSVLTASIIACASAKVIRTIVNASIRSVANRAGRKKPSATPDEIPGAMPDDSPEASSLPNSSKAPRLGTELDACPESSDSVLTSGTGSLPYRRDDFHAPRLGCSTESEEAGLFDLFLTDEGSVGTCQSMGRVDWPSIGKTEESASATKTLPSLEARTEDVVRQITQVQNLVTKSEEQTSPANEPFNETLKQLNDQISSIRHYASSQQDRVEKLQNGYDWNIIRTFCLRIIRCIDNLDDRIERLPDDSAAIEMLSDIRDELLFSLESSGVEQFDLELDSEFCGQERLAEAIKEKEVSDNPELKGRIAHVVRPGYQYMIDDENVKTVRTARVKLYG